MIIKINSQNIEFLEKIFELEKEIFENSYYSYKTLKDMSENKNYTILCYGDVKGYMILHDTYDAYEIMKIAVNKNYRRNNIGKKLLQFYTNSFETDLILEVRESNDTAISFYENFGFTQIGKRKNYYSNGETAILMSFSINKK